MSKFFPKGSFSEVWSLLWWSCRDVHVVFTAHAYLMLTLLLSSLAMMMRIDDANKVLNVDVRITVLDVDDVL